MRELFHILFICSLLSCQAQLPDATKALPSKPVEKPLSEVETMYLESLTDTLPSKSTGTVSNGRLENGKLIPFAGTNYVYFDTASYLAGRAHVNHKVKQTVIDTYEELERIVPEIVFCYMEASNKEGGQIFPHRTHQNGTSMDFMVPKQKYGIACYELDNLGKDHYFIDFDNSGKYLDDNNISINIEMVAQHIICLEKHARMYGLKIKKVIFKIELLDDLFATENGRKLKTAGIYFTKSLEPLINNLHDDHYHIDFEVIY